jgi:hypothetical protein
MYLLEVFLNFSTSGLFCYQYDLVNFLGLLTFTPLVILATISGDATDYKLVLLFVT